MKKVQQKSLSQRASLTAFCRLLQQGTQFIISFVVSPIIVTGLGKTMFGAWNMMAQSIGFLALTDLRPMGTLKFTLAVRQYHFDEDEKARQLGAAIYSSLAMLPLLLIGGWALVWWAPEMFKLPDAVQSSAAQKAMLIMVINLITSRLLSFPGSIINGENIEYKGFWPHWLGIVAGGAASVAAMRLGWGIIGIAGATLLAQLLTNVGTLLVVMRNVTWLRFVRPSRKEFIDFLLLSLWLFGSVLLNMVVINSNALLTGFLLTVESVSLFTVSSAGLRMIFSPIQLLLGAGNAGIIGLCGKRDWDRIRALRLELHLMIMLIFSVVGCGFIFLNEAFVGLWIQKSFFAGKLFSVLMAVLFYLRMAEQVEGIFVDGAMIFARKTLVLGLAVVLLLAAAWPLAKLGGLSGICGAYIVGFAVLLAGYGWLIGRHLEQQNLKLVIQLLRPGLVMVLLWAAAWGMSYGVAVRGWWGMIGGGIVVSLLAGSVFFLLGLNPRKRKILASRVETGLPQRIRKYYPHRLVEVLTGGGDARARN